MTLIVFDEAGAAYTLTPFAAGNIFFAYPLGLMSDIFGRFPLMFACAFIGLLCLLSLSFLATNIMLFLVMLVIIGGTIVGLYSTSLALVGDHFSQSKLVYANATFGIIYAAGSLIGPIVHGTAMQLYEPHGMIVSAVLVFVLFLLFASHKAI